MTVSILPGGPGQGNPEFGQQKSGLDEAWSKALEKAHFEKQRESMTAISSGRSDSSSSDTVYGVDGAKNKVSHAGEETRLQNQAPQAHQITTSGTLLPAATASATHGPAAPDLKPLDGATFQGVNIQTNSPPKSIRSHEPSGGSFRTLRFERLVPGSVFPAFSVNMLPGDSGVELVIRSQVEAGSRLVGTIKEVQAFLAETNQKLASIRVNGEVISTFAEASDDGVSLSNQKPDKINRTY